MNTNVNYRIQKCHIFVAYMTITAKYNKILQNIHIYTLIEEFSLIVLKVHYLPISNWALLTFHLLLNIYKNTGKTILKL